MSAGKICARVEHGSSQPLVITGIADVIQEGTGTIAKCKIPRAGDYVVLQMSYRVQTPGSGNSYNTRRWTILPIPHADLEEATNANLWTTKELICASALGAAWVVLLVCVARFCCRKVATKYNYKPEQWLNEGRRSQRRYDSDDDDDEALESLFTQSSPMQGIAWKTPPPKQSKKRTTHLTPSDGPDIRLIRPFSLAGQAASTGMAPSAAGAGTTSHLQSESSTARPVCPSAVHPKFPPTLQPFGRALLAQVKESLSLHQSVPQAPQPRDVQRVACSGTEASAASVIPFGRQLSDRNRKMLLEMAAVGARNANGGTALHMAAAKGCLDTVRAILDAEDSAVDVSDADYSGRTPLHMAAKEGHDMVAKELTERGLEGSKAARAARSVSRRAFDINRQDHAGDTVLHMAASKGHSDVIQALHNAANDMLDTNIQNKDGWTPLQIATKQGHQDATMGLLEMCNLKETFASQGRMSGASDADTEVITPLHLASRQGNANLVRMLLQWMRDQEDADGADDGEGEESSDSESEDTMQQRPWRHAISRIPSLKALKVTVLRSKSKLRGLLERTIGRQHSMADPSESEGLVLEMQDIEDSCELDEIALEPEMTSACNEAEAGSASGCECNEDPDAGGGHGDCSSSSTNLLAASEAGDGSTAAPEQPQPPSPSPDIATKEGDSTASAGTEEVTQGGTAADTPAVNTEALGTKVSDSSAPVASSRRKVPAIPKPLPDQRRRGPSAAPPAFGGSAQRKVSSAYSAAKGPLHSTIKAPIPKYTATKARATPNKAGGGSGATPAQRSCATAAPATPSGVNAGRAQTSGSKAVRVPKQGTGNRRPPHGAARSSGATSTALQSSGDAKASQAAPARVNDGPHPGVNSAAGQASGSKAVRISKSGAADRRPSKA